MLPLQSAARTIDENEALIRRRGSGEWSICGCPPSEEGEDHSSASGSLLRFGERNISTVSGPPRPRGGDAHVVEVEQQENLQLPREACKRESAKLLSTSRSSKNMNKDTSFLKNEGVSGLAKEIHSSCAAAHQPDQGKNFRNQEESLQHEMKQAVLFIDEKLKVMQLQTEQSSSCEKQEPRSCNKRRIMQKRTKTNTNMIGSSTENCDPVTTARTSEVAHDIVVLNNKDYRKYERLGRGGSAEVFRVGSVIHNTRKDLHPLQHRTSEEEEKIYALKVVRAASVEEFLCFRREIAFLKYFRARGREHRGVIYLHDYEENEADLVVSMLLDYCDMDFDKFLKQFSDELGLDQILDICRQMSEAISAVHRANVIHFDIKPANFLMKRIDCTEQDNDPPDEMDQGKNCAIKRHDEAQRKCVEVGGFRWRLLLADFGCSCVIGSGAKHIMRRHRIGTVLFMAPEAVWQPTNARSRDLRMRLGQSADIWSLGVTLFTMVYPGRTPYSSADASKHHVKLTYNELLMAIADVRTRIEFPRSTRLFNQDRRKYSHLMSVLKGCLAQDPSQRWTSTEVGELLAVGDPQVSKRALSSRRLHLLPDQWLMNVDDCNRSCKHTTGDEPTGTTSTTSGFLGAATNASKMNGISGTRSTSNAEEQNEIMNILNVGANEDEIILDHFPGGGGSRSSSPSCVNNMMSRQQSQVMNPGPCPVEALLPESALASSPLLFHNFDNNECDPRPAEDLRVGGAGGGPAQHHQHQLEQGPGPGRRLMAGGPLTEEDEMISTLLVPVSERQKSLQLPLFGTLGPNTLSSKNASSCSINPVQQHLALPEQFLSEDEDQSSEDNMIAGLGRNGRNKEVGTQLELDGRFGGRVNENAAPPKPNNIKNSCTKNQLVRRGGDSSPLRRLRAFGRDLPSTPIIGSDAIVPDDDMSIGMIASWHRGNKNEDHITKKNVAEQKFSCVEPPPAPAPRTGAGASGFFPASNETPALKSDVQKMKCSTSSSCGLSNRGEDADDWTSPDELFHVLASTEDTGENNARHQHPPGRRDRKIVFCYVAGVSIGVVLTIFLAVCVTTVMLIGCPSSCTWCSTTVSPEDDVSTDLMDRDLLMPSTPERREPGTTHSTDLIDRGLLMPTAPERREPEPLDVSLPLPTVPTVSIFPSGSGLSGFDQPQELLLEPTDRDENQDVDTSRTPSPTTSATTISGSDTNISNKACDIEIDALAHLSSSTSTSRLPVETNDIEVPVSSSSSGSPLEVPAGTPAGDNSNGKPASARGTTSSSEDSTSASRAALSVAGREETPATLNQQDISSSTGTSDGSLNHSCEASACPSTSSGTENCDLQERKTNDMTGNLLFASSVFHCQYGNVNAFIENIIQGYRLLQEDQDGRGGVEENEHKQEEDDLVLGDETCQCQVEHNVVVQTSVLEMFQMQYPHKLAFVLENDLELSGNRKVDKGIVLVVDEALSLDAFDDEFRKLEPEGAKFIYFHREDFRKSHSSALAKNNNCQHLAGGSTLKAIREQYTQDGGGELSIKTEKNNSMNLITSKSQVELHELYQQKPFLPLAVKNLMDAVEKSESTANFRQIIREQTKSMVVVKLVMKCMLFPGVDTTRLLTVPDDIKVADFTQKLLRTAQDTLKNKIRKAEIGAYQSLPPIPEQNEDASSSTEGIEQMNNNHADAIPTSKAATTDLENEERLKQLERMYRENQSFKDAIDRKVAENLNWQAHNQLIRETKDRWVKGKWKSFDQTASETEAQPEWTMLEWYIRCRDAHTGVLHISFTMPNL